MKAIERLYQYFDFKKIKPTRLEKDLGLGNGYFGIQLRREADIGSSILEKIFDNCRDLDPDWLIAGNGTMERASDQTTPAERIKADLQTNNAVAPDCEKCIVKDDLIASLRQQIELQSKLISHLEAAKRSEERGSI